MGSSGAASLPINKDNSWRISFHVQFEGNEKSLDEKVAIVSGARELVSLRMDSELGSVTFADAGKPVSLSYVLGPHLCEIYNVRGALTFRWDGVTRGSNTYAEPTTAVNVGGLANEGNSVHGIIRISDWSYQPVDQSLANVPADVPVQPEAVSLSEPETLNVKAPIPAKASVTEKGELLLTGRSVLLATSPYETVRMAAPVSFPTASIEEADCVIDNAEYAHKMITKPGEALPIFICVMPDVVGSKKHMTYLIGPHGSPRMEIQHVDVNIKPPFDDALKSTVGDGTIDIATNCPLNNMFLFEGGRLLAMAPVQNSIAKFPSKTFHSGDNKLYVLGIDSMDTIWGPLPLDISIPRSGTLSGVVMPDSRRQVQITYKADPALTGSKMAILCNHHLVQLSELKDTARLIYLPAGQKTAHVQLQITRPDGIQLPDEIFDFTLPD